MNAFLTYYLTIDLRFELYEFLSDINITKIFYDYERLIRLLYQSEWLISIFRNYIILLISLISISFFLYLVYLLYVNLIIHEIKAIIAIKFKMKINDSWPEIN